MKKEPAGLVALAIYFGSVTAGEQNPLNGCSRGAHVEDHPKLGKICVQDRGSWGDPRLSDTSICPPGIMFNAA